MEEQTLIEMLDELKAAVAPMGFTLAGVRRNHETGDYYLMKDSVEVIHVELFCVRDFGKEKNQGYGTAD